MMLVFQVKTESSDSSDESSKKKKKKKKKQEEQDDTPSVEMVGDWRIFRIRKTGIYLGGGGGDGKSFVI